MTAETKANAARRDALLDASIEFIGTLTGMKPPPIEVAPPEVFAPFRAFVEKVEGIVDAACAAPATAAQSREDAEEPTLADARRYKLLRRGQHWSVINGAGDTLRGEQLDAAVDAARLGKGGANHG